MIGGAINLMLRGLQFLWTLLIMSLVGNMIADAYSGNPSIVNYDMFVSIFGMATLLYLIPATVKDIGSPMIMLVLDALNVLFFLIGGIATAAYLGVHSCSNRSYTLSNIVTNGAPDMEKRCREAQASTAFLWFGFAAFAASLVFSGMHSRSGGSGVRRGPAMSQV